MDSNAILENDWLVGIRHCLVHYRAVTVSVDMRFQSLVGAAPAHRTDLLARQNPIAEPMEDLHEPLRGTRGHQVDKSIAQVCPGFEVCWQIDEVVLASETLTVDQVKEHLTRIVVGNVPEIDCCAFLSRHRAKR